MDLEVDSAATQSASARGLLKPRRPAPLELVAALRLEELREQLAAAVLPQRLARVEQPQARRASRLAELPRQVSAVRQAQRRPAPVVQLAEQPELAQEQQAVGPQEALRPALAEPVLRRADELASAEPQRLPSSG